MGSNSRATRGMKAVSFWTWAACGVSADLKHPLQPVSVEAPTSLTQTPFTFRKLIIRPRLPARWAHTLHRVTPWKTIIKTGQFCISNVRQLCSLGTAVESWHAHVHWIERWLPLASGPVFCTVPLHTGNKEHVQPRGAFWSSLNEYTCSILRKGSFVIIWVELIYKRQLEYLRGVVRTYLFRALCIWVCKDPTTGKGPRK